MNPLNRPSGATTRAGRAGRRWLAASLLVLGAGVQPAAAQEPQAIAAAAGASTAPTAVPARIPAEVFFKPARMEQVSLSPSGRRLVLRAVGGNGRMGLFVVDLQGQGFRLTRAVLFGDGDVHTMHWLDDERLIFDVTDLQSGLAEGHIRAPGLFVVRFDGEDLTQLVATQGRAFMTAARRDRMLPPNHELLHVPALRRSTEAGASDEVIVGEWVFSRGELSHVAPRWLNVASGRTRAVIQGKMPCAAQRWWFNAAGEPRAVRCVDGDRESLQVFVPARDGQGGSWRQVAEAPRWQLGMRPVGVAEGDTVFVAWPGGAAGEEVVGPLDVERGVPGPARVSAPGFDFRGQLLRDAAGQRLLGVRLSTDSEQTVWFDAAHQAAQQRVDAALPGRVNRLECRRCGDADAVWLVLSYSDQDPGQLVLWRQADEGGQGRWWQVGRVRPDIDPEQMGPTDLARIRARDGRDLPVWITRPAGQIAPAPAVVLVHGGPWVRGRHWNWQAMPQFLASRGYVVIEPEFRGSDGYGQAHLQAGFRQWGLAMQDDVADALRWAQGKGLASEAACIIGGSYGGYSTLMGLIRHPELYRCGSAWVAVADLFLYLEGSWRVDDDLTASARRFSLPQRVGDVKADRAQLEATSPLHQAARLTRPLQLVWGQADRRVPIDHGERLRRALREAGREPEWIVYEGEGHGWRKPEHQVDFARRLEAFLDRHLKTGGSPR